MTAWKQDPFSGMKPHAAPPGLKSRVLEAASKAGQAPLAERGLLGLLWESRGLRIAWGAAFAALLVINVQSGFHRLQSIPVHTSHSLGVHLSGGAENPATPVLRGRAGQTLADTDRLLEKLDEEVENTAERRSRGAGRKEGDS